MPRLRLHLQVDSQVETSFSINFEWNFWIQKNFATSQDFSISFLALSRGHKKTGADWCQMIPTDANSFQLMPGTREGPIGPFSAISGPFSAVFQPNFNQKSTFLNISDLANVKYYSGNSPLKGKHRKGADVKPRPSSSTKCWCTAQSYNFEIPSIPAITAKVLAKRTLLCPSISSFRRQCCHLFVIVCFFNGLWWYIDLL